MHLESKGKISKLFQTDLWKNIFCTQEQFNQESMQLTKNYASTVKFSNYPNPSEKDFKTFWFQYIFALDGQILLVNGPSAPWITSRTQ